MVVLDKGDVESGQLPPDPFVEALEEKSALVAKYLGFEDKDIGNGCFDNVHGCSRVNDSNSKSKRHHRWLVFGSSTYCLYAFVASILAASMSSLI
jgi:hypothetical protein